MPDNERKWALVTGATGGLGQAFCEALAERGYNLVLSARHLDALEALAGRLRSAHGVEVVAEAADLAEPNSARALKSAIDARGIAIETLINNAGFGVQGEFRSQPIERIDGMIAVNVLVLTELTHAFANDMAARGGGHIMLLASTAAFEPIPGYAVYAATKAYVLSLAHALNRELRRCKVVVTALCPGPTETAFFTNAGHTIRAGTQAIMMKPEPVVEIGLKALHGGKASVVAGVFNRIIAFSMRLAPRTLQARVAAVFMGAKK